jgi:hypothetical protein
MNAVQFLSELQKENLTGREFLALIGHTEISNDDYTEIKDNPNMDYARLVEIMENSPISDYEFANLIETARERRAQRNQKQKREDLESQLTSILQGGSVPKETQEDFEIKITPIPDEPDSLEIAIENTSEIIIGSDMEVDAHAHAKYSEPTPDELWAEADIEEDTETTDPVLLEEFSEYGGSEDFDTSARRENTVKIAICLCLGVTLAFSSFFIRYMTTGSWGLPMISSETFQSYEDVFEFQTQRASREINRENKTADYAAENYTESKELLSMVASSEQYLFRVIDHAVTAVEIDSGSGKMEKAPVFVPGKEIAGIFELNNRLYVVCEDSYTMRVEYELVEGEGDNEEVITGTRTLPQPQVTVYEFNSLELFEFDEPTAVYSMDGTFRSLICAGNAGESGFFIITDYVPTNDFASGELAGYIPSYSFDGETHRIPLQNIEAISESPHSNMTLVGGVGESFTLYAALGNSMDSFHITPASLSMSFYSKHNHESHILRYNVFGGVLTSPVLTAVEGFVEQGFIDERGGVMRVVSNLGGVAALTIFDSAVGRQLSHSAGNIAKDQEILGVAFAPSTVYIIATNIYAIETSNPNSLVFLDEVEALISDARFYQWGEKHFFSVGIDTDSEGNRQGISVTMHKSEGGGAPPRIEHIYRLPLEDAVWHDYIRSSAESFRDAVAVSINSGVMVIPVTYFNSVTRVETFFVLNYTEEDGFIEVGRIDEFGLDTQVHAALIRGEYIYTFWDNVIRCLDITDLTVIDTFEM